MSRGGQLNRQQLKERGRSVRRSALLIKVPFALKLSVQLALGCIFQDEVYPLLQCKKETVGARHAGLICP